MTPPRRYSDDEVERIFERATLEEQRASDGHALARRPHHDGTTLEELQAIGAEAGISRDAVARAARSLDVGEAATTGRMVGLPVAVGRTADLPRAPTDREWDLFVTDLRQAFGARGRASSEGSLRSWTNGNLHALVEPTDAGWRLRMGTRKGDAAVAVFGSMAAFLAAVMTAVGMAAGGELEGLIFALALFVAGFLFMGITVARLPRWAGERRDQMDALAARMLRLTAPGEGHPDE